MYRGAGTTSILPASLHFSAAHCGYASDFPSFSCCSLVFCSYALFYCKAKYPAPWGEAGRQASKGYLVFGRRTRRAKSRNAPSACGGDRDFEPAEFTQFLMCEIWAKHETVLQREWPPTQRSIEIGAMSLNLSLTFPRFSRHN